MWKGGYVMEQQFAFKMKALRILENEHRLIMSMMTKWFDTMRELENTLEDTTVEVNQLMEEIADFKAILNRHQVKEDKYFYTMLGNYIGLEQGPIMPIKEEHVEVEQYFTNAFVIHEEGKSFKDIIPYLQEAYEILFMHMYKEENVLFPMGEKQFKTVDEEVLLEQINSNILNDE
ncbi:hemerythrin domain-containing protein [Abyssicoccus albus]